MLKVSIIIPVYNVSEYLPVCLHSLISQTLDGIEVVFVDDHGSDDSMERVREFASKHPSIVWKYTKTPVNSGPGFARNCGLKVARGEYVCFVDADDWIDPDFCEKLYRKAKETEAEMACCDILIGDQVRRNPPTENKKRFLRHFVSYFTTFIYKLDFLRKNGIVFPDTHSAEDSCFLSCSLLCAQKISSVKEALYHYVVRPSSVSQKPDRQRASQRMASFRYLMRFAEEKGLYKEYRLELWLMFIKKGWLMSLKDRFIG